MNTRLIRIVLAVPIAALLTGPHPNTFAQAQVSVSKDDIAKAKAMEAKVAEFQQAVTLMETYIHIEKKQLILSISSAKELGISEEIFQSLKASLASVNAQAKNGELNIEQVKPGTNGILQTYTGKIAGCAGTTMGQTYWWGRKIFLNECKTQTLLGLMAAGAGAVGICAALAPGIGTIACGVIAGAIAISAGLIQAIDGWGGNRGVIFYVPWVGPSWAVHQ